MHVVTHLLCLAPPIHLLCLAPPQVDYELGDCGRSWMVGFGEKYPQVGWGGWLLCLHTLLRGPYRTGWKNGGSSSAALHVQHVEG